MSHKVYAAMGHEKEPKQPHGPRQSGRPPIHSHSARPKRHLKTGGGKRSRR